MFHTYVTASSGRKIDIDRAMLEMDLDLFAEAERAMIKFICPNGFNPFDIGVAERMGYTTEVKAGIVWRHYCGLHEKKYGVPFVPDVSLTWDA